MLHRVKKVTRYTVVIRMHSMNCLIKTSFQILTNRKRHHKQARDIEELGTRARVSVSKSGIRTSGVLNFDVAYVTPEL